MNEVTVETRPLMLFWGRYIMTYRVKVILGQIRGAIRVLFGKSATIPKGRFDTLRGPIEVRGYYGGCTLVFRECDLYWNTWGYDGSGAGCGQEWFDDGTIGRMLQVEEAD